MTKARFRLVHVPAGAYGPSYSPGSAKRRRAEELAHNHKTPEQLQAQKAGERRAMREVGLGWGVAPEDIDLWIDDPAAYRAMIAQRRALEKIHDQRARTSVEGDTDINHDNLEG